MSPDRAAVPTFGDGFQTLQRSSKSSLTRGGAVHSAWTLIELARELRTHPRTIAAHLEAKGTKRRVNRRKMSEAGVVIAAHRYRESDSLATIGSSLRVDASTIRRELHWAGA